MECLDCGTMEGVEYRLTSDRAMTDGKAFPRCELCLEKREAHAGRTLELLSPCRPSWFSETSAGERWEEDL